MKEITLKEILAIAESSKVAELLKDRLDYICDNVQKFYTSEVVKLELSFFDEYDDCVYNLTVGDIVAYGLNNKILKLKEGCDDWKSELSEIYDNYSGFKYEISGNLNEKSHDGGRSAGPIIIDVKNRKILTAGAKNVKFYIEE